MSFEEGEREERGDGQAGGEGGTRAQTPVSSLPSFLCFFFFFFFMNRHCKNNSRQKGKCRTEAQAPLKTFCNASF